MHAIAMEGALKLKEITYLYEDAKLMPQSQWQKKNPDRHTNNVDNHISQYPSTKHNRWKPKEEEDNPASKFIPLEEGLDVTLIVSTMLTYKCLFLYFLCAGWTFFHK